MTSSSSSSDSEVDTAREEKNDRGSGIRQRTPQHEGRAIRKWGGVKSALVNGVKTLYYGISATLKQRNLH